MVKIGVKNCMIIGCVSDFTWIILSSIPGLSYEYPESTSIFLSPVFIYSSTVVASMFDGFGNAIQ